MPWIKALLRGVFGLTEVVETGHLRFIVQDGSTVQVPGSDHLALIVDLKGPA